MRTRHITVYTAGVVRPTTVAERVLEIVSWIWILSWVLASFIAPFFSAGYVISEDAGVKGLIGAAIMIGGFIVILVAQVFVRARNDDAFLQSINDDPKAVETYKTAVNVGLQVTSRVVRTSVFLHKSRLLPDEKIDAPEEVPAD
ncbi:hypothetical protein BGO17_02185 [Candidatus Saccharibacteria bacterium 49-20]|nr:MAG: hypothetical protein BGO17_02185 [Candidatus Saccharibacteria bacterium 49-20]